MYWLRYDDDTRGSRYVANEVPKLAKSYDLAVTGNNLETAYEYDVATKTILEHFKVFARMTPDAKETVIECLHSVGKLCLMCGDGANGKIVMYTISCVSLVLTLLTQLYVFLLLRRWSIDGS